MDTYHPAVNFPLFSFSSSQTPPQTDSSAVDLPQAPSVPSLRQPHSPHAAGSRIQNNTGSRLGSASCTPGSSSVQTAVAVLTCRGSRAAPPALQSHHQKILSWAGVNSHSHTITHL